MLLISILSFLTLLPAAFVWWRGRRLARMAGSEAVLAERLAEAQRRNGIATFLSVVLLMAIGPAYLIVTLPLAMLLVLAADYPARRRIHGESWSFVAYLSFWVRWTVAFGGFWMLLALTPWLVVRAGSWGPPAAVILCSALLFWSFRFHDVFLALLRARPLNDPTLETAFEPVLARATVARPRIWRSDPRGGLVLTAFALPSPKRGGVLFLQPLLDRLPQPETTAIFAHEVAHLEQFAGRRLRLLAALGVLPIAFAAFLVPVVQRLDPATVSLAVMLWPIIVVIGVVLRQRRHQPLELAGDRRAAELCGDPEAVASALIRLYALARMPRRLDVDVERWASHPSLARRVQALRAMSSEPLAPIREPVTFAASDHQGALTFEADGVRIGSAELTPYSNLHELRLDFRGESPRVVGRDRTGRVFRVPIRADDAAPIHSVLDRVDGLLAPELPRPSAVRWGGTLAALAALVAVLGGPLMSVFVAAGLAVFWASAPTLAAAATAATTGGVFAWLSGDTMVPPVTAVVLCALGIGLALASVRAARQTPDRPQRIVAGVVIAVLAAGTALAWAVGVVLPGAGAWRLHHAAVTTPAIAVLPLSLAAALWAGRGSARRVSAAAVGLLGMVPAVTASDWYVSRAVNDPFIAAAPRLDVADASLDHRQTIALGAEVDEIHLSPAGRWLAAALYDETGEAEMRRFALRAIDGRQLHLDAHDLAFLDDDHILVSERVCRPGAAASGSAADPAQSIELSLRRLESGLPVVWRESLPSRAVWRLDVSPRHHRWRVLSLGDMGEAVRFEGQVGTAGWKEHRWKIPAGADPVGIWHVGSGAHAVRLERFETSSWQTTLAFIVGGSPSPSGYVRAHVVDSGGAARTLASELRVDCVPPPVGRDAITCLAFDGRRARVFRLGDAIVPVAIVPGALWLFREHEDGTLVGSIRGRSVLIQPQAGRIVSFDEEAGYSFGLAYTGTHVAVSSYSEQTRSQAQVARVRIR